LNEVLAWYGRAGRDLPWRRTRDPYRVLVSELMLQQTQVARVVPYYQAWLERFPDERVLASAPVADALRFWSGLGYNRRALHLHAAASRVVQGGWPRTARDLRALPGVGPYTAAAVASFAFGEPVAAVDTNVRRVIERIDGRARPPAALARRAARLLPAGREAEWNHALMDLGATVCTARAPRCGACPVTSCRSRGTVRAAPRRAPGTSRRFEDTERFVRGRIVAELAGGAVPADGYGPGRFARAVAALERDGLVIREGDTLRLP
jgi:A/G-specific adenine glycosylase